MKFLVIDELSMVSSELWTDVDPSMEEIFMMIPEKAFAGLSVHGIDSWVNPWFYLGSKTQLNWVDPVS